MDAERHPDALADRQGGLAAARRRRLGRAVRAFTWWSGPINTESATAFTPGQFDTQGIVPIGYAVFAMALGIAAGTVFRRILPALAATLGAFGALLLILQNFVRPHYLPAVTKTFPLADVNRGPSRSDWLMGGSVLDPHGAVVGPIAKDGGWGIHGATPAHCSTAAMESLNKTTSCLSADGYRALTTYQPASRYWAFQGIESAIRSPSPPPWSPSPSSSSSAATPEQSVKSSTASARIFALRGRGPNQSTFGPAACVTAEVSGRN